MKKAVSLLFVSVVILLGNGCKEKDMSMKMNCPRNIKGVWSFKRVFNDGNDVHLPMAQSLGIPPLNNRDEAEHSKDRLQEILSGELYDVDSLTHSIPFLVPRAVACLDTIGQRFLDSLASKGLNPYRVRVTSVLRTKEDVAKLRRRNINAVEQSAHSHGTTFDISWKRFNQIPDPGGRPHQEVGADTLKLVLSEVLRDMKDQQRCYVKYELKQGCFHITTR